MSISRPYGYMKVCSHLTEESAAFWKTNPSMWAGQPEEGQTEGWSRKPGKKGRALPELDRPTYTNRCRNALWGRILLGKFPIMIVQLNEAVLKTEQPGDFPYPGGRGIERYVWTQLPTLRKRGVTKSNRGARPGRATR